MNLEFEPKEFLKNLSSLPGIYQMLGASDKILYIGKAKNLKKRVSSYFRKNLPAKTCALMQNTHEIKTIITNTEAEALILENNLIKKHKPKYNILLRDDKSYPYIYISDDKYPYVTFHRGAKSKTGEYFGPFPGAQAVRESLKLIQKIFKTRQCDNIFFKNRSRPCLNYQIKLCTAPCTGLVEHKNYLEDIRYTKMLLKGKSTRVTDNLEQKMLTAAKNFEYEKAATFRDQIKHIRKIQNQQFANGNNQDIDVVALALGENIAVAEVFVFKHGNNLGSRSFYLQNVNNANAAKVLGAFISQHYLEQQAPDEIILGNEADNLELLAKTLRITASKKVKLLTKVRGKKAGLLKLAQKNANIALTARLNLQASAVKRLESLQDALQLDSNLHTIECFDISHTAGQATVASCVVFKNGTPARELYRKYNIKAVKNADDYAAMRQALTRRYSRMLKENSTLPDMIIVDGGKGQLKQAIEVLTELQIHPITILAVAKGENRKPGKETLFLAPDNKKITLAEDNLALLFIQQIRDEAHRFAISSHRQARGKAQRTSSLQQIPGIGNLRRKKLLNYFGGLQEITQAGVDDLAKVKGISRKQAQKIYDYLHEQR